MWPPFNHVSQLECGEREKETDRQTERCQGELERYHEQKCCGGFGAGPRMLFLHSSETLAHLPSLLCLLELLRSDTSSQFMIIIYLIPTY